MGLILDRGYFSAGNIRYFEQMGYDFFMMVKNNSGLVVKKIKDAMLPPFIKAKYYLPEHEVYAMTKTGSLGDEMTVRYFHIYYDNVRASMERNEYLKQMQKKEEHLLKKVEEKYGEKKI